MAGGATGRNRVKEEELPPLSVPVPCCPRHSELYFCLILPAKSTAPLTFCCIPSAEPKHLLSSSPCCWHPSRLSSRGPSHGH